MAQLPGFLHGFFWDIDPHALDVDQYQQFVIERILEYGDERAIRWLCHHFGAVQIKAVVCQSRRLSRRTANFWRLLLDIPKEEVQCLSSASPSPSETFWSD